MLPSPMVNCPMDMVGPKEACHSNQGYSAFSYMPFFSGMEEGLEHLSEHARSYVLHHREDGDLKEQWQQEEKKNKSSQPLWSSGPWI